MRIFRLLIWCALLALCSCTGWPSRQPWVRMQPLVQEESTGDYILRVEVFAATDKSQAERKARELIVLIKEPVYLVYEDPQWKVRTGDFTNRENAEMLKKELLSLGYNDARVVAVKAE